jgi:hypothetical protein
MSRRMKTLRRDGLMLTRNGEWTSENSLEKSKILIFIMFLKNSELQIV